MSQLTKPKSTIDFKVNQITGEAFISIRKTAELLNIPRSTFMDYISRTVLTDTKQGLTPEMLQLSVQHYALSGSDLAVELLGKLAEAGAKAFIYHGAGLQVSASPIHMKALPQDYVAALRELARTEEEKIILKIENAEKHIETDSSEEYFTIRKIRSLNIGLKLDPKPMTKVSESMNKAVKKVFDLYDQQANAYHVSVWEEVYPDAVLP